MVYRFCLLAVLLGSSIAAANDFRDSVAPILERRCLTCHNADDKKGGLSLETAAGLSEGGDSGPPIVAGQPDESYLLELITPEKGRAKMPKNADPLKPEEIAAIRKWIESGAAWPDGLKLVPARVASTDWWSLQPLVRREPPKLAKEDASWIRTPIDAFIAAKHRELGLTHAPEADRRTLIRRLYFDLIGLPPSSQEIEAFLQSKDEQAYERLVDQLLESPHYGERWARHWLDVVHFGESHGYDKDKPRSFAWPYRDYVIRSFNSDKRYDRFVQEQIAGDVLYPDTPDGIEALGFISAGPWDFIGHAEVPESKIDGKVARHLDRDDMVTNTIQTFCSLTIQCAQCHNHKFDPILQEEYYQLQAVFAALDRTDKRYDPDPKTAAERTHLVQKQKEIRDQLTAIRKEIHDTAGEKLKSLESKITALEKTQTQQGYPPEYGYHSAIAASQETTKWVQVDFGKSTKLAKVVLRPCHDDFNGIGDGFGFPIRYKVELSDDAEFKTGVLVIDDHTNADVVNPKLKPVSVDAKGASGQYLRLTATRLAPRLPNDFIFAIAELEALDDAGKNLAQDATVVALDSIEAPVRWRRKNLVDGLYPGGSASAEELAGLRQQRDELIKSSTTEAQAATLDTLRQQDAEVQKSLAALPPQKICYVGSVHHGQGTFTGTGASGGKPRPIFLLNRGNVTQPGKEVVPGALSALRGLPPAFDLPADHQEGERRVALARWLSDRRNSLTWRSIVNRVWQYHFGRGLVDSPNDFGRNGGTPSHPELLDHLAAEFRDGNQSFKSLHRTIVLSATYRQTSAIDEQLPASKKAMSLDAENRFLWRMNRRKVEAELVRDSVLTLAGKLDRKLYGPSFQDFVIEKPEHSPHYQYHLHDPNDPKSHRRSVYRFLIRSQPQPFMASLDCADPSMQVDKRNESLSALQALTLLNNAFMVTMSKHFAARIEVLPGDLKRKVHLAHLEALGRPPGEVERAELVRYAETHGLANLCRVLINLNEFVFVD